MAAWGDWQQVVWNGAWAVAWLAALVVAWRTPLGRWRWAILAGVATVSVGYKGYWLPAGALAFLLAEASGRYSSMGSAAGVKGPKAKAARYGSGSTDQS